MGERGFRLYFTAQAVSALGSAMSALAVTFAVLGLGAGAGGLGVVLASGTVPALLLMLVGGVAGDRWDRRTIMVVSASVLAVTTGALALLVLSGRAALWHFVVAEVVGGATLAFVGPTSVGLVPSLVPAEHVQAANSLRLTARNVAAVLGPPLAGLLVAASSPGWALAADAASYVVSAVLLSRIPPVGRPDAEAQAGLWAEVRAGWSAFVARRWVVLVVAASAVYQATVLPAIFVVGPVVAARGLGGAGTWALVLSARAVGALLAGLVLLRWRPRRPVVAASVLLLLDVPFLLALLFGLPAWALVGTSVASSLGAMASDTVWETALQAHVPQEVLSRVSSYDWFGSMVVSPLGYALVGVAVTGAGVAPVLLVTVAVTVAVRAALSLSPSVRSVTRAPLATAPPGADAQRVHGPA